MPLPNPEPVTISRGDTKFLHQPTRYCLVQVSKRTYFVGEFSSGSNLSPGQANLRIYSNGECGNTAGMEMFPVLQISRRTKNLNHQQAMFALAKLWVGEPIPEEFLLDESF